MYKVLLQNNITCKGAKYVRLRILELVKAAFLKIVNPHKDSGAQYLPSCALVCKQVYEQS